MLDHEPNDFFVGIATAFGLTLLGIGIAALVILAILKTPAVLP